MNIFPQRFLQEVLYDEVIEDADTVNEIVKV